MKNDDALTAALHDARRTTNTTRSRRFRVNRRFAKGVALGAVVSALTLVSTAAFAGTGIGGVFNLGKVNTVNATTALQGSTNGQQLRVVNSNTGTAAAGIGIQTNSARPPLAVNSSVKVGHLNADLLDGLDSSALQKRVSGTCGADGTAISSIGPTGTVTCSKSAQIPIHTVLENGNRSAIFVDDALTVQLHCRAIPGAVGFNIINTSSADTALNWMFSQGGTTSTVNTNGQAVHPNSAVSFSLAGARLEGQFIWADAHAVVTLNLHVVNDPNRCEFSGTALVAATS